MNFYPNSRRQFTKIILKKFPNAKITEDMNKLPEYLLWMLEEIEKMDGSRKATRWLGYVIGRIETLELCNNSKPRDIVRIDVKNEDNRN